MSKKRPVLRAFAARNGKRLISEVVRRAISVDAKIGNHRQLDGDLLLKDKDQVETSLAFNDAAAVFRSTSGLERRRAMQAQALVENLANGKITKHWHSYLELRQDLLVHLQENETDEYWIKVYMEYLPAVPNSTSMHRVLGQAHILCSIDPHIFERTQLLAREYFQLYFAVTFEFQSDRI